MFPLDVRILYRLNDLNLRREFLRHRKQPGGRKDQRFRGKVAERRFIRRLTLHDVNEKYRLPLVSVGSRSNHS
jgi:hypothetical protein